jgi:hypothetical protein
MALLVTSASGINGAEYGKVLAFTEGGQLLRPFTDDSRVPDPRGLGTNDLRRRGRVSMSSSLCARDIRARQE